MVDSERRVALPLIWTPIGDEYAMNALAEYANNPANTLAVALFRNNYIPTTTSVLANFTEANFPGYAPQDLVLNGAFINGVQQGETDADPLNFTSTGPSTNIIFGYFIYNGALEVVCAERLAGSGVPFFVTGTQLILAPRITGVSQFNV